MLQVVAVFIGILMKMNPQKGTPVLCTVALKPKAELQNIGITGPTKRSYIFQKKVKAANKSTVSG